MWSDCPSCRMFGGKQFRRKNYELLVEHLNTHVLDIVIVTWLLVLRSFGTHLPVGLTIRKLPSLFRLFSRLLHESPLRECFSLRRVEDFFRALVRTCVRFFGFRCVFRCTARRVFRMTSLVEPLARGGGSVKIKLIIENQIGNYINLWYTSNHDEN